MKLTRSAPWPARGAALAAYPRCYPVARAHRWAGEVAEHTWTQVLHSEYRMPAIRQTLSTRQRILQATRREFVKSGLPKIMTLAAQLRIESGQQAFGLQLL
jgi:hypothetical protein